MTESCSESTIPEFPNEEARSTKVRFSCLKIRLYDPCVSDNPGCSSGPPIGIDWTYVRFNERALKRACRKSNTSMNFETCVDEKDPFSFLGERSMSTCTVPTQQTHRSSDYSLTESCYSDDYRSVSHDHVRRLSDSIIKEGRQSLDSCLCSELIISVDEYEAKRTQRARVWEDMLIPSEKRRQILLNSGYTEQEIAHWTRKARKVRYARMQTYHNLVIMNLEERFERMRRRLKRCCVKDKDKRKAMRSSFLYDQWKNASPEQSSTRNISFGVF